MSKWHGGKGDKNRTGDYEAYTNNYDKIFSKKMKHTAIMADDVWSFRPGQVDLIEGDTIEWERVNGEVVVEVVKEAPFKFGEASGNAGKPFSIKEDQFDSDIKPFLK